MHLFNVKQHPFNVKQPPTSSRTTNMYKQEVMQSKGNPQSTKTSGIKS